MRVTSSTTNVKGKVCLSGVMVADMMDSGQQVSNMEKESIPKVMVPREQGSGKTEEILVGTTIRKKTISELLKSKYLLKFYFS